MAGGMIDRRTINVIVAAIAIVAALAGGAIGYDRYKEWRAEKYVVTREDDGRAITRVVAAAFAKASALKVGTLTGTVQGAARDSRAFGLLQADQVVKEPFAVEYFVNMDGLARRDLHWNPATRELTVTVPDITVGAANIDEGQATLVRTGGLFVTRGAAEALARQISVGTTATAQAEARKPAHINAARANARAALTRLMEAPLDAAGYDDVTVRIRFPFDPAPDPARWDTTRSLHEVLGNAR